eukprot:TRINITY_DN18154_c0_g1_i1.p1 TRINITY_DN18154_c0_g1~~TRINITY_DN18154_c0_g1_i1.p1  ORF type:complete len:444 (+),score=94.89 TRINITY_DN18154_c0_g1_i1:86-1333(+)
MLRRRWRQVLPAALLTACALAWLRPPPQPQPPPQPGPGHFGAGGAPAPGGGAPQCLLLAVPSAGDKLSAGRYLLRSPHTRRRAGRTELPIYGKRVPAARPASYRYLYASTEGNWSIAPSYADIASNQAFFVSEATPLPHLAVHWQTWTGKRWARVKHMRLRVAELSQCREVPRPGAVHSIGAGAVEQPQHYEAYGLPASGSGAADPFPLPPFFGYPVAPGGPLAGDAWPTVQLPHRVLSIVPRVLYFPGFLSPEECRGLAGLGAQQDAGLVRAVTRRVLAATGFEEGDAEALSVAAQRDAEELHADIFDPAFYGPQMTARAAAVLLYLRAPDGGGDEWFPADHTDSPCGAQSGGWRGLRVKADAAQGAAVVVYSMRPDGGVDRSAVHGRCAVTRGTLTLATTYLRVSVPHPGLLS